MARATDLAARRLAPALARAAARSGPTTSGPRCPSPEGWREVPAAEPESLANTPWWELFQDPSSGADPDRAGREQGPGDRGRAHRGGARALRLHAAPTSTRRSTLAAAGRLRSTPAASSAPPRATGCDDRGHGDRDLRRRRRRVLGARLLRPHPPRDGGRARALPAPRRRRAAPSCWRSSPTWRAPTSSCATLDRRLEISRRTLESRREYVELAKDRFEGGLTSELDWRQAEAELHRIESFLFDFERLVVRKENELSVLLGRNPGPIPRGRTARRADAAGRRARRAALGAARAPARHARGRAEARLRPPRASARPRRCSTRASRSPAPSAGRAPTSTRSSTRRASPGPHRQPAAADLQRRPEPAPRRGRRVAAAAGALRLRALGPAGLPRGRGRARRPTARRASSARPRASASRPSARCSSWPSCATAAAWRPTSRCSTRSARCSTPSSTRPQTVGSEPRRR